MLTVQIDDAKLKGMLQRLAQRMGNLSPVLEKAGAILRNDALDNFKAQRAPDGTPWAPLKRATLAARRKGKGAGNAQILRDTGVLMNSIGSSGGYGIHQLTPTSVTIGTRVPYAAIHQNGGTINFGARSIRVRLRKNKAGRSVFAKDSHKRARTVWGTNTSGWSVRIPARPFIGLSDKARGQIVDTINRYMGTNQ